MRLRRVRLRGPQAGESVAVLHQGQWVPLRAALQHTDPAQYPNLQATAHDMLVFLARGQAAREEALRLVEAVGDAADWAAAFDPTPLLPVEPRTFRDFMLYEEHVIAAARGMVRRFLPKMWPLVRLYEKVTGKPHPKLRPKPIWYEKPIYYMGSPINFYTEGETIPWPSYTQALDYELELGLIIVRPLYNASPQEALEAIGGFVVINDFSARDVQLPEMFSGFGPVKAKNFANGMSMVVATPDEILPRVDALRVEVRVNGQVWGQGTTAGMQHSLGEMVAYASLGEQVVPGEVMATGTIPGCSGVETDHWLSPGDEITLEIEGIGTLTNRIGGK